jgi:CRP/FNR family transcriptional regulator, cyclic AMP receptor protein
MSIIVTPGDLQAIELLAGLTDQELHDLIAHCEVAHCPPDTDIVRQADAEQTLFFLLDGSAQVILHVPHVGDELVAELPPKSVFGEVSFFHAAPHTATVRCVSPARLLRLRRERFEELRIDNNQMVLKIGCNAASILAERIQQTNAWVAEQLTSLQDRRIHESWLRFRERTGRGPTVSGGFKVSG